MSVIILSGTVAANGTIISGDGFTVVKSTTKKGTYSISFDRAYSETPSIVGNQTGYGENESPADGLCFPILNKQNATAITGDSVGDRTDRQFSFIVMGK